MGGLDPLTGESFDPAGYGFDVFGTKPQVANYAAGFAPGAGGLGVYGSVANPGQISKELSRQYKASEEQYADDFITNIVNELELGEML